MTDDRRFEELALLLCDPATREPLRPRHEARAFWLEAESTGRRYEVRDGIPVLLGGGSAKPESHRERLQDLLLPAYDGAREILARLAPTPLRGTSQLAGLEVPRGGWTLGMAIGAGERLGLLPPAGHYVGQDFSWQTLRRCHRRNRMGPDLRLDLVQGAAERLPFRNGVFDAVFCLRGVGSFPEPVRVLAEMVRVAPPGTRIIVAGPTADLRGANHARIEWPNALLPPEMSEVELHLLDDWEAYRLAFRRPRPPDQAGKP